MSTNPEAMTEDECWRRIGSRGIGRIGFNAGSGPRIHPVDYSRRGSEVRVRTSTTSELARFTRLFAEGGVVTLQVDQVDAALAERWSVLISAQVVAAGRVTTDDRSLWPSPTPEGEHDWGILLRPRQVTGRRLAATTRSR